MRPSLSRPPRLSLASRIAGASRIHSSTVLYQDLRVWPAKARLIILKVMRKGEALTWLEKGYEEHDQGLRFLKVNWTWDPLRSEPRFQAVLRRMNFPQ